MCQKCASKREREIYIYIQRWWWSMAAEISNCWIFAPIVASISILFQFCVCEDNYFCEHILRTQFTNFDLFHFFSVFVSRSHFNVFHRKMMASKCACSGGRIKVKEIHDKKRANQDHWLQINFEIDNISCTLPTQPFIALLLPLFPFPVFFFLSRRWRFCLSLLFEPHIHITYSYRHMHRYRYTA